MSPTGSMKAFHHVTLAVKDVPSAVADWESLLGWTRAGDQGARFDLASGFIELVAAGEGPTGVVGVAVVANDISALAEAINSAGGSASYTPAGTVRVSPSSLNGVSLELLELDGPPLQNSDLGFTRFSHLVVAVSDFESTVEQWKSYFGAWPSKVENSGEVSEHVPVGKAWFGITAAGTNAEALERFVARSGEGVYAVGIVVDDLTQTVADLQGRGARLIGDATSPQLFVHPATTHGLLMNLVQSGAAFLGDS